MISQSGQGILPWLSVQFLGTTTIFVGLQTSADKIYIIRPTAEDDDFVEFRDRNDRVWKVERGILRPCLLDVHFSDFCSASPNAYMIFPYKVGKKADIYSVEEMETQFPKTLEYLSSFKENLKARNLSKLTADNWFQFGRSQSLIKFNGEPKLVWSVLMKRGEPRYVYDDNNVVFTGGGNGPYYGLRIRPDSSLSLFYIQAVLHHPVIDAMVAGSTFQGGYISHGKQFVEELPIKDIDFNDAEEKGIYDNLIRVTRLLNDLARKAQTATTPQKKEFHTRRMGMLKREMFVLVERLYGLGQDDLELVQGINEQ